MFSSKNWPRSAQHKAAPRSPTLMFLNPEPEETCSVTQERQPDTAGGALGGLGKIAGMAWVAHRTAFEATAHFIATKLRLPPIRRIEPPGPFRESLELGFKRISKAKVSKRRLLPLPTGVWGCFAGQSLAHYTVKPKGRLNCASV